MKNFNLDDLKDAFGSLKLSILEAIVLAFVLLFAIAVGYFYFNTTQPLQARLDYLRNQEKKIKETIKDEGQRKKELEDQRQNAKNIIDSLEDFEDRLHNRKIGIPAIMDEITQLAKVNRVKAGDITFQTAAADPLPVNNTATSASPSPTPKAKLFDKKLNVYEGLGIDTTVEGDYHDLRRFIAALEHSRNFVIINAIALQSVDQARGAKALGLASRRGNNPQAGPLGMPANNAIPQPDGAQGLPLDGSAPTKTVVSLKLEMETHFSREQSFEPAAKPIPASAPATAPKQ